MSHIVGAVHPYKATHLERNFSFREGTEGGMSKQCDIGRAVFHLGVWKVFAMKPPFA